MKQNPTSITINYNLNIRNEDHYWFPGDAALKWLVAWFCSTVSLYLGFGAMRDSDAKCTEILVW